MAEDSIWASLMGRAPMTGAPNNPQSTFQREYVPPIRGGFGTPAIAALLQMTDPMGLSPDQMNQNAGMRGPLYKTGQQRMADLLMPPQPQPNADAGQNIARRNSLDEDLNSVMIKYDNWRKAQTGQELTPQERVTQGFIDQRNPNSRF